MSEPEERYVCDPTMVMRARLLFGVYSSRTVSPRWRHLAQAYCVTVAIAAAFFIYQAHISWHKNYHLLLWIPSYSIYYVALLTSLYTGDEHVFKFISQNHLTDVTLDSPNIFSHLQKQIKQAYTTAFIFFFAYLGMIAALFFEVTTVNFFFVLIPSLAIDIFMVCFCATNMLVMAVFDARLLILKRRLQRYGFRTRGYAPPQPYCQIYDEVRRKLEATDTPLKLLIFFDLIYFCCKLTSATIHCIHCTVHGEDFGALKVFGHQTLGVMTIILTLVLSTGYVMFLESAAVHCEDMAVFIVTQLIKNPTTDERQRMYEFLRVLKQRGARYQLLRALPIDARFMMRMIGFCSAQVIVIINTIRNSN